MKNYIGYIIAGFIGGALVLGIGRWTTFDGTPSESAVTQVDTPVKLTSAHYSNDVTPSMVPTSFNKAAEKSTPAVVKIKTISNEHAADYRNNPFQFFFGDDPRFNQPRMGAGSGVIITSDGYIVTNNHVITDADDIEVTLNDNRIFKGVKVGVDSKTDLAVIKIEGSDLPTLEYGDSDEVEIGDWVLAVGNPFEYLTSTVTAGIVSAKGRNIGIIRDYERIESFIQTDAAVNPGNSGGALVNLEGELIGINTAIASQTGTYTGYSFAIPVNLMKKISEDIIQYGSYKRAMLGVGIQEIDQEVRETYELGMQQGVLINNVQEGGAAELAGVLPLDVVVGVDDIEVHSVPQLQEVVGGKNVGDKVELVIMRKGERITLPVRLKE